VFFRFNFFGFIWAFIILILSLLPGSGLPTVTFWEIISFDKFVHGSFYMIFVFLMLIGFTKQYSYLKLRYHAILAGFLIGIMYGVVMELAQLTFIADRQFEMKDIFANTTGCIMGTFIFKLIYFQI